MRLLRFFPFPSPSSGSSTTPSISAPLGDQCSAPPSSISALHFAADLLPISPPSALLPTARPNRPSPDGTERHVPTVLWTVITVTRIRSFTVKTKRLTASAKSLKIQTLHEVLPYCGRAVNARLPGSTGTDDSRNELRIRILTFIPIDRQGLRPVLFFYPQQCARRPTIEHDPPAEERNIYVCRKI